MEHRMRVNRIRNIAAGFLLTILLAHNSVCAQDFLNHRNAVKLDTWKFYNGEIHSADSDGAIDETGWEEVTIPHTWNAQDVLTDGPRYYQGIGWYRTSFRVTRNSTTNRFFIRFEGVSLTAEVYCNGNYLGTHRGGYSAFIFEVTQNIRNGEPNTVAVKVNNATQLDVAPSGTYLYPIFGGIYRPVTLFSTGDLCISPLDYASTGVYISPVKLSANAADVEIATLLNYHPAPVLQTQSQELVPANGIEGIGLLGEYYANPRFEGTPVRSRLDPHVVFNYGGGSPFSDIPVDGFSIVWTGRFVPKKSGMYRFLLKSDDGSRLYIDGKRLIDHWGSHAASERWCEVRLTTAKEISLRIEYNELGGEASVKFGWIYIQPGNVSTVSFLSVEVTDRTGTLVISGKDRISIKNNSEIRTTKKIRIKNPHLWDARRNPYIYRLSLTLSAPDGTVIDRLEQPFGLRYFTVDRDSGLILNGRPYHVYGVCRHQEWQGLGPALTDKEHEKDFSLIKELGANGIRFAHYQQADIMYRLCDENGLVAWAEIPNTPAYRGNIPGYLQNCTEQLTELVKQNYNHPSILFWGLFNEVDIPAADLTVLHKTAKQIDPYRLTTQADNVQPTERHSVTDIVAWNWYFGWYYGNWDEYGLWYDSLHREYPGLKSGLSEYGAEACITQQQENPKRPDPVGRFFPEQYQNQYHEEVWQRIQDRRDIWCKFVWNMFDFSWTYATRGDKPYMNYKGLVTHDRNVRKDAFYFYKANWSDEPVLHIVSKRNSDRKEEFARIAVYTNLAEVELSVNGKILSKKTMDSDIHKIQWDNVRLLPGKNLISVTGLAGAKDCRDSCEWYYSK